MVYKLFSFLTAEAVLGLHAVFCFVLFCFFFF